MDAGRRVWEPLYKGGILFESGITNLPAETER